MWPDGRTALYAIWKACVRVGIIPPGVPGSPWDDLGVETQALVLGFDQTASHDEDELAGSLAGAKML